MWYFQPRATQRPATPAGHVGFGIGENGSRPFLTAFAINSHLTLNLQLSG